MSRVGLTVLDCTPGVFQEATQESSILKFDFFDVNTKSDATLTSTLSVGDANIDGINRQCESSSFLQVLDLLAAVSLRNSPGVVAAGIFAVSHCCPSAEATSYSQRH